MKKVLLLSIIATLIIVLGVLLLIKDEYKPESILRSAVKEYNLSGENYILCQRERTTGFDWVLIKNEDGKKVRGEYCNVIGANPFDDFTFKHEFITAGNTFIFYIDEKQINYSEEMRMDIIEYIATGWDILYPVKHDIFDIFNSKKYITEKDLWKD